MPTHQPTSRAQQDEAQIRSLVLYITRLLDGQPVAAAQQVLHEVEQLIVSTTRFTCESAWLQIAVEDDATTSVSGIDSSGRSLTHPDSAH